MLLESHCDAARAVRAERSRLTIRTAKATEPGTATASPGVVRRCRPTVARDLPIANAAVSAAMSFLGEPDASPRFLRPPWSSP